MYKLAVFDLDGTLLNDHHEISDENMEAINALRKEGYKITIATGRIDLLTKDYVKKLNIQEPIITCNGSLVRNPFTKQVVYKKTIPPIIVKKVLDICKADNHLFMVYSKDSIISTNNYRVRYFEERNKKLEPDCQVKFEIEDNADYISDNYEVYKILVIEKDQEKFNGLKHKFGDFPEITSCQSHVGFLDINPSGTSKKEALKFLAMSENIKPSEIVAFGDNYNDIEMLEYAGCAITTENGVDAVKEICNFVSIDNNLSGVSYAIKNFLLKK